MENKKQIITIVSDASGTYAFYSDERGIDSFDVCTAWGVEHEEKASDLIFETIKSCADLLKFRREYGKFTAIYRQNIDF